MVTLQVSLSCACCSCYSFCRGRLLLLSPRSASEPVRTEKEREALHTELEGSTGGSTMLQLLRLACRNGPGAFEVGTQPVAHPFDGQGLVTSIAIRGGRAFFRSRYVETAE